MDPKKEILMSGGLTNSYVSSQTARVLGYAKCLFIVENRGGGSGIGYIVDATPNLDNSLSPWVNIYSSTVLLSGNTSALKLEMPWDAIRIRAKNLQDNQSAYITVWGNRDPR